MPERIDPAFERLLVETLAERAERVPATLTRERVQARLEERRRRKSVRRPLALLGLAAAVMLPLAALVAGQRPTEPVRPLADAYQAIIQRNEGDTRLVVAMRGDGQERLLTAVPIPDPRDDRRRPPISLSPDGWLAIPGSTGWEFRNRHNGSPDRTIGPLAPFLESETGRAWIGGSRYATWNEASEILILDPAAATVERLSIPESLGNVVAWTADGSAVVVHGDWASTIEYGGERYPAEWRVIALAGGSTDVTLGDLDLGWRDGGWWRDDGSRLQLCDMAVRQECPGLPNGALVVESPDGTLTPWYTDELAPDDVVDAVFGGTGPWILLDRRSDGRQAVLARLDAPGDVRTLAAWDPGSAYLGSGSIEAVAPDDSLVVADSRLIDGRTGAATSIGGSFIGFVPSEAADQWSGEAFEARPPAASAEPQPLAAYPTLRPLDDVLAEQLVPEDRVLWREEHAPVDGPPASPSILEIGPIELDQGLGVFLVCSGPSDVLVTMPGPDGEAVDTLTPLLSRCLDSEETAGGYSPEARIAGPVRFLVTATADTAWQLVVFDPAPPE